MAEYHHVTVTFPNGNKVRGAIKGDTLPPELARLNYVYGIKIHIGGRVKGPELARLIAQDHRPSARRKGAAPARPLSPDFGRGSGRPV